MLLLRRMLVCMTAIGFLWLGGLYWFAQQIPTAPTTDESATDAIVVLTGGPGRIRYGLKILADGRAPYLFISGMETPTTAQALVRAAGVAHKVENPAKAVTLGFVARNTIGNAQEVEEWLRARQFHSVRLVTSNYHMPRALSEFHYELPNVRVVPDPVIGDYSRTRVLDEYHKYLAAELRHSFIDWVGKKA